MNIMIGPERPKSKVYIKLDESNRVVRCEGGYTEQYIENIEEWIFIDEGYGDKYNLCQTHYFDKPLMNMDRTHNYIYENDVVRETTDEEKQAELDSFPPPPVSEEVLLSEYVVDQEYRLTLIEEKLEGNNAV